VINNEKIKAMKKKKLPVKQGELWLKMSKMTSLKKRDQTA